jgi:predicted transcriptional regulator
MPDVSKVRVLEVMERKLVAVAPMTTIRAAAKLVNTSHVDTLPVVESGKLVGILMAEDVLAYSKDHDEREMMDGSVELLMRKPIFVERFSAIKEAIRLAMRNGITRVPVVDTKKGMRCIGLVSTTTLLKEMAKAERF